MFVCLFVWKLFKMTQKLNWGFDPSRMYIAIIQYQRNTKIWVLILCLKNKDLAQCDIFIHVIPVTMVFFFYTFVFFSQVSFRIKSLLLWYFLSTKWLEFLHTVLPFPSLFWEVHILNDKVNMIKITGDHRFTNKICTANIK